MLELVALIAQFFVFGKLFIEVTNETCLLLIHCDSLASVLAIAFERPKSKLMIEVLSYLHENKEFRKLKQHMAITHVKGLGNVCGDVASRGEKATLEQFTSQLRIKSMRLPVPKEALNVIHHMVQY